MAPQSPRPGSPPRRANTCRQAKKIRRGKPLGKRLYTVEYLTPSIHGARLDDDEQQQERDPPPEPGRGAGDAAPRQGSRGSVFHPGNDGTGDRLHARAGPRRDGYGPHRPHGRVARVTPGLRDGMACGLAGRCSTRPGDRPGRSPLEVEAHWNCDRPTPSPEVRAQLRPRPPRGRPPHRGAITGGPLRAFARRVASDIRHRRYRGRDILGARDPDHGGRLPGMRRRRAIHAAGLGEHLDGSRLRRTAGPFRDDYRDA
jgi:hypothetical protein